MSHLNFYKAGTIGGTDGTLVTSVNINESNRSFSHGSDDIPYYVRTLKCPPPSVHKLYLRCDTGFKVTSGTITFNGGKNGNPVLYDYQTDTGAAGNGSYFYRGYGYIGSGLFTSETDAENAINSFTSITYDGLDLSKHNIYDKNVLLLLAVWGVDETDLTTLSTVFNISYAEETA